MDLKIFVSVILHWLTILHIDKCMSAYSKQIDTSALVAPDNINPNLLLSENSEHHRSDFLECFRVLPEVIIQAFTNILRPFLQSCQNMFKQKICTYRVFYFFFILGQHVVFIFL